MILSRFRSKMILFYSQSHLFLDYFSNHNKYVSGHELSLMCLRHSRCSSFHSRNGALFLQSFARVDRVSEWGNPVSTFSSIFRFHNPEFGRNKNRTTIAVLCCVFLSIEPIAFSIIINYIN